MIRTLPFEPGLTPALVEFWQATFGTLHNALRVTPELLRRRIFERTTAVESFDPRGMILACEGDRVDGVIHAAVQPESVCRALDPDWGGGDRGQVLLMGVAPRARGRGIGHALWDRAMEYLRRTGSVSIDGQCLNPFYGNSDGPAVPFWGTPEGISLPWGDEAARRFLQGRGHAPRYRAVTLAGMPGNASAPGIELMERACPVLGGAVRGDSKFDDTFDFETAVASEGGKAVGTLVFYPMHEARPGLFGIYETHVLESHQGRGYGKALLSAALGRMAARGATHVEVLTIPDLSGPAVRLYESFGFTPVAEWAVY